MNAIAATAAVFIAVLAAACGSGSKPSLVDSYIAHLDANPSVAVGQCQGYRALERVNLSDARIYLELDGLGVLNGYGDGAHRHAFFRALISWCNRNGK